MLPLGPALAALALAAADAVPAPAPAAPPARALDLGGGAPSLGGAAAAVTLLAALAAAALLLSRRRRLAGRMVEVLETTSLGPRRSLVVARVGGELLLLASSEAGIAVLPARLDARAADARALAGAAAAPAAPPDEGAGFDGLLQDTAEDQELRMKLARGLSGAVR